MILYDESTFFEEKNTSKLKSIILNRTEISTAFNYLQRISIKKIEDKFKISLNSKHVVFIGSGITNLYAAYELVNKGFSIEFFDQQENPLNESINDKPMKSATFGGKDARVFSFTEARHHFSNKDNFDLDFFRKNIFNGGRLCTHESNLSYNDEMWIREFESIPQFLSKIYHEELVQYNQRSYLMWSDFFGNCEEMKNETGYSNQLLRIYADEKRYSSGIKSLKRNEAYIKHIDKKELLRKNPALEKAYLNGDIYKCVLEKGFSINIHQLCFELIRKIEEKGGIFHWNKKVTEIVRNKNGIIKGIIIDDNTSIYSSIFILSPGAFGKNLLNQLNIENTISSVIGMWLSLPNENRGLLNPIKLARNGYASPGPCESANIIVENSQSKNSTIHISSGHGLIGINQIIDDKYLKELGKGVIDVAQRYFLNNSANYKDLENNLSYCIRPWTPSCLGIFRVEKSEDGIFIITGGHNTGGFAQAPVISQEIVNILKNKASRMLTTYHPQRFKSYLY